MKPLDEEDARGQAMLFWTLNMRVLLLSVQLSNCLAQANAFKFMHIVFTMRLHYAKKKNTSLNFIKNV